MCRNIKRLRQPDRLPTEAEMEAAALQFVRKVSGYQKPSAVNKDAFETAVAAITTDLKTLFENLTVR